MPDSSPLTIGQALSRWTLHTVIFVVAGGLAAGISSLLYEAIAGPTNSIVIYGIIFAAGGWIAYQLSRRAFDKT